MTMIRRNLLAAIIALLIVSTPSFSSESKEVKLGKSLAKQVEKSTKLVTDEKLVGRVNRIGKALAEVAKTQQVAAEYGSADLNSFEYEFKIINDPDINAFSLPGGITYVHKGLLDFVKSDDELAGVLAHEVAHAAHHHMATLLRKQTRMDTCVALIALVGGLSKMNGKDLTNVVYGAQFVRTARLTGYGQDAERDADKAGAIYAMKAGFNPAGAISFLNRLTEYLQERGEVRNLGIFQTHPPSEERCMLLAKHLSELGVAVDMREAVHLSKAEAEPAKVNGKEVWQVVLAEKPVCLAADADGMTSRQRAERTSSAINALLREGMNPMDVKVNPASSQLVGRGKVILNVTPADSAATGAPAATILKRAAQVIRYALWTDWVKTETMRFQPD